MMDWMKKWMNEWLIYQLINEWIDGWVNEWLGQLWKITNFLFTVIQFLLEWLLLVKIGTLTCMCKLNICHSNKSINAIA